MFTYTSSVEIVYINTFIMAWHTFKFEEVGLVRGICVLLDKDMTQFTCHRADGVTRLKINMSI
jgi:hypothetical protein